MIIVTIALNISVKSIGSIRGQSMAGKNLYSARSALRRKKSLSTLRKSLSDSYHIVIADQGA